MRAGVSRTRFLLAGVVASGVLLLLLGGCGGEDSVAGDASEIPTQSGEEAAERAKPAVAVPPMPPPTEVVVEDLIEGTGAEAGKGDEVAIRFVGLRWSSESYADSWERASPSLVVLGSGRVAPGLDRSIRGMKVGGRREVLVPIADLRTPDDKNGGLRPSNAVIFVVDLLGTK